MIVGDVKVEGKVHGNLQCGSLLVVKGGAITGNVSADRVIVCGRVAGSIDGQDIALKESAVVEGAIYYQQLTIEKGAVLKGTSRPSRMPLQVPAKEKQKAVPVSVPLRAVGIGRAVASFTRENIKLSIPRPKLIGLHRRATRNDVQIRRDKHPSAISIILQEIDQAVRLFALRLKTKTSPKPVTPAYLIRPRKPKTAWRFQFHVLSPLANLSVIAAAALLTVARAYDPAPAITYPLAKTVEVPADRELVLLDARGRPFARRGGCVDSPVTYGEIPEHFIDALLAVEDRRFFAHVGIDPIGVVRAAVTNYAAGKIVQGGSTITQQLAKVSYLTPAKSFERKVKEAIAVLRLEGALKKEEILERYLSRAYFGEGCFGLRAAARYYFKQPVAKLTISESAMLVALLKSPTQLTHDKDALESRETHVLDAMVNYGRLEPSLRDEIKPAKRRNKKARSFGAFYADWIADTAKVADRAGFAPLPIRTNFDPMLQRAADNVVGSTLRRSGHERWAGQAALVAMRPDGRVLAMVGGKDYRQSQFNRASQALRQPGSSFKAFVYLAALRAGGSPDMMVVDEPITIGDWNPKNYNGRYQGMMPLRRAFSSSINTVSVRLTQALGPMQVAKAARDLGITTPISDEDPSIALGTSEVTLLGLTSAYAAFAANAYPVKPWGVVSLGKNGAKTGRPPKGAGRWRLTESESMREFLQATVQSGTGRAAQLSIASYGKTGTSQNYRDAWFVGFAGNLVVGVWVGNDDNSPMNHVTGGNLPAQMWKEFVSQARHVDRNFNQEPSKIAAFKALPSHHSASNVQSAALQSVLLTSEQRYAGDYFNDPRIGNAMLVGPAASYPERQPIWRPHRRSGTWDPFAPD